MLLELPEHRLEPRQVAGQQHRARAVLAGQPERRRSARRARIALAPRARTASTSDLRAVGVGVDHQHHAVVGLERVDLVGQLILDRRARAAPSLGQTAGRRRAVVRVSSGASSDALGQRQEQREPAALPDLESTWISPPSSRAISREIDSPRPVPPYLREVVPSACWNASKIALSLSSGMPDAGVGDREGDHALGAAQRLVARSRCRRPDSRSTASRRPRG